MLDRTGSNYGILRRWLGSYVAEPAWIADNSANFFIQSDQGRVEKVEFYPATKEDLEGPLNNELKTIQARLKKAKPETDAEQSLYRVVRQTFNALTTNLEQSDHECFLFKYREGKEPWRLVWCWGYQRTDQEPAKAAVCSKGECNQLFVRRPKEKARCPGCETITTIRRPGWFGSRVLNARTGVIGLLILLLLLYILGRPKLDVTPVSWNGPQGSKVEFKVIDRRWFIFNSDVTGQVVPLSNDPRVIQFDAYGTVGRAKSPGRTFVTLRYKDRAIDATVDVGPPRPPKSITIEPAKVKLAVGATKRLIVMGQYDDAEPIEFTEMAIFEVADENIAVVSQGRLEGAAEGNTKVTAMLRLSAEASSFVEASADVEVQQADYKSLELAVEPATLGLGQSGRIVARAVDKSGEKYSVSESSLLKLKVEPATAASFESGYLIGKSAGSAELKATLGELTASFPFTVSSQSFLPPGTFVVTPAEVNLAVGEYFKLDVASASFEPIVPTSSNPDVVSTIGEKGLAGRSAGSAEVTVKQGGKQQVVKVNVKVEPIESLHIRPSLVSLRVGEPATFRVTAKIVGGREFDVVPDLLVWAKQPLATNVDFNRDILQLFGLRPTDAPQTMVCYFGEELSAAGSVTVSRGGATIDLASDFMVYPPVGVGGAVTFDPGSYFGGKLLYKNGSLVLGDQIDPNSALYNYRSMLAPGTQIVGINGTTFDGMDEAAIRAYFAAHPIVQGDIIQYRGSDGIISTLGLNLTGRIFQDVSLVDVQPRNLTPTDYNAEMQLQVLEEGEYRITDATGTALSDWQLIPSRSVAAISTSKIARTTGDDYELFIERRTGEAVRKFQLTFKLKLESP